MPIYNLTSYLPVMQEFIEHWGLVNAALGTKPLILSGGYALAGFVAERAAIQDRVTAVTQAEAQIAPIRQTLGEQKTDLNRQLGLFRKAVLGQMAGTLYTSRLPIVPHSGSTQALFIRPHEVAANVWTNINIAPPVGFFAPLVLADGTTLSAYQAAIAAYYVTHSQITEAETAIGEALARRDNLLPAAREHMKQYRLAVFARLAPGDALLARVPRLTPRRPPKTAVLSLE